MRKGRKPERTKGAAIVALMLIQAVCAAVFLADVIRDYLEEPANLWSHPHLVIEMLANVGLVGAIAFEGAYLVKLLRRQAHIDRALSVASGALHEVMEEYFAEWGLTPSEADVANFTIKGFTIAEIAALRGSAEGTVKTHLNAIYRKSGLQGRAQLVNLLVDELLGAPVVRPDGKAARPAAAAVGTGAAPGVVEGRGVAGTTGAGS